MIIRALALFSIAAFAADEKPAAALGPYIRFTDPDTALVRWETAKDQIGSVEFGETTAFGITVAEVKPTSRHEVTLRGLKRDALYYYRLKFGNTAGETLTLETDFNFTKAPIPDVKPFGENADAVAIAERILPKNGPGARAGGYALVLGDDGRVAWELARRSGMSVVAANTDADVVARGRAAFDAAGVYGHRLQVLHAPSGPVPVADAIFDLVAVIAPTDKFAEPLRVLRPGGIAWLGNSMPDDEVAATLLKEGSVAKGSITLRDLGEGKHPDVLVTRSSREGIGAWSHAYGDAGQSTNSSDKTVRGRGLALRWFGEPGVRGMMDRQPRNPPPLCMNGTFFIQGNERLFAVDSSNGAFLWSMEVPGMRRVNIPRDCANMCADDAALYIAMRDRAWRIDARSGELTRSFMCEVPDRNWGYLAVVGDQLFGSTSKPGAAYTRFEGGPEYSYDFHHDFASAKVLADSVFACAKTDGRRMWTYKTRGFALNSSISVGGGRVYFIESRALAPWQDGQRADKNATPGRLESPALYKEMWLVALDAATGAVDWERPVPLAALGTAEVIYLSYADEKLVVLDSALRAYHTFAYSAKDGAALWSRAQPWARDHHGGHLYHPVILRGMVLVEPFGYDLATGDVRLRDLPERGGCSTLSAAAECLHFINWDYDKGSLYVRDFSDDQTRRLSGSRGNCWISFISGSGMMLLPAASGGCTCRYPNQVSLGFAPGE